jgi:hypothetical protein
MPSSSLRPLGKTALIAGGSLAGMLGARAIAAHFEHIIVLERDAFEATPAPRRTTPQSHHVHMLLKGGENAIDRILPGFRDAIEASGSVKMRAGLDFLAGSELGFAPRWDSGMELHGQSRWMLEHCLRQACWPRRQTSSCGRTRLCAVCSTMRRQPHPRRQGRIGRAQTELEGDLR